MAKKKTEAKSEATAKKKGPAPAARKAEGKAAAPKSAAKSGKPTSSPAMPMVDTNLAAQTAAQMLGAGLGRRDPSQAGEDKREGSLIRQLKADLNKGHSQTVSNVLDQGAPQGSKKSGNQPFGQKQVGRNQTYGADVTRSGVPRRTSG
jgi:hypothetical protein